MSASKRRQSKEELIASLARYPVVYLRWCLDVFLPAWERDGRPDFRNDPEGLVRYARSLSTPELDAVMTQFSAEEQAKKGALS